MKIRCGFVTNSSSSNFILGIKPRLEWSIVGMELANLREKDSLDGLPIGDDMDRFVMELTARAVGHDLRRYFEASDEMTKFWQERMQKEQDNFVIEFGEDAAYMKNLEAWERIYGPENIWPWSDMDINDDKIGLFPKRAIELAKQGYAVYIFVVQSWDEGFSENITDWAGNGKRIISDNIVIWVQPYY